MIDLRTRREFLRIATAAGASWAAADLLEVHAALASAAEQHAAGASGRFESLTPAQALTLDAMASRILPSVDGRPGAHEAGAVLFMDRALATFNASSRTIYAKGVADLDRRATRAWKEASGFVTLSVSRQEALLRVIEKTPFFQAVRFDTIVGTFGLPSWGGNREYAGWRLLGLDHQPAFQPPFGFYDANANSNG